MRKNYVKVSAIMAAMAFMLTGCGGSYPAMTLEQEEIIGEYAAALLLKYDANSRSRLVSREEVKEAEEAEKVKEQQKEEEQDTEPTQEGMDPTDDTPTVEIGQETNSNSIGSPEEFFGLAEGIVITYQGNEVCDSYPQDEDTSNYFSLDATEGKQLLVLKFHIENQSQTDQHVDLLSKNAIIGISANGSYNRNVLTTMLMDDMSTYVGDISAGETVSVVLLAEVEDDIANNISTLMLNLKNDSKKCTIQLK